VAELAAELEPVPVRLAPVQGSCERIRSDAAAEADPAAAACARALEATVRYALAEAAARTVRAEMAATRARLRGIEDRRLPQLAERTRTVLAELDEQERAKGTRLRWAARRNEARTT